jgi:broad specificity phosphatase PhoE
MRAEPKPQELCVNGEVSVILIRHGEAAASWDTHVDPPLGVAGRAQAAALVAQFAGRPAPRLVSSPLSRAQETAAPLATHWGVPVAIEEGVRELPSCVPLAERRAWLGGIMRSSWPDADDTLQAWRERAWQVLLDSREDTLVFTHFMVINALVSRVMGDERLVVFEPDYCSATELRVGPAGCQLITLGKARTTLVL